MDEFALTGRKTPEWQGRTPDSKPPKAVIDRLFLRQMGRCAITGRKFMPGDVKHVDHIVPLKDGGQNRETNMQLVAEKAHREKTAAENSARAKEQRMRMKNNGTWPKSKTPLRSRGFNPGRNRMMGE